MYLFFKITLWCFCFKCIFKSFFNRSNKLECTSLKYVVFYVWVCETYPYKDFLSINLQSANLCVTFYYCCLYDGKCLHFTKRNCVTILGHTVSRFPFIIILYVITWWVVFRGCNESKHIAPINYNFITFNRKFIAIYRIFHLLLHRKK